MDAMQQRHRLKIGWGHADITPQKPVLLRGQFHARVSEGVRDPITATAMAIEAVDDEGRQDVVVLVSCDLVSISPDIAEVVRERVSEILPQIDPRAIIMSATHTHTAPASYGSRSSWDGVGVDLELLGVMDPDEYVDFCAGQVVSAIRQAWEGRREGGMSWGLGEAVISHNRLWTNKVGISRMYGNTNDPEFSHIEGYEDHTVGLIYTWDANRALTGIVINIPCPSQVSEGEYQVSADFWHDIRQEIKRRLGDDVFVLGQCAPAGDQSPHHIIRKAAHQRMLDLFGEDRRQQIARKVADCVEENLAILRHHVEFHIPFAHTVKTVHLPRRALSERDVEEARREAVVQRQAYEALHAKVMADPALRSKPRWYTEITRAYALMRRHERVPERAELTKREPKLPVEVHVLRLGDLAIATNPFEFYLDYGMQIHARSPAVQTMIAQLTGTGTGNAYVPTERSVAGGGYGAVPASTIVGPEGGLALVEETLEMIGALWS